MSLPSEFLLLGPDGPGGWALLSVGRARPDVTRFRPGRTWRAVALRFGAGDLGHALADGAQSVNCEAFERLMGELAPVASPVGPTVRGVCRVGSPRVDPRRASEGRPTGQ